MTKEFFEAVKKGDLPAVKEWLAKDPGVANAKTENGFSAIVLAAYYGQGEAMNAILAAGPTLSIHDAALVGDLPRVKEMLGRDGSLVSARSPDGFTPLGLAAYMGRPDVVRFLLSKGADVNYAAPETGFTALTGAVNENQTETVRVLVEHGADVNHRYEDIRFSPLMNAAFNGNLEIARTLVDRGADVNARTTDGKTPLSIAVEKGNEEVAAFLRAHGARA